MQCMGLDFKVIPSNFEEYLDDVRSPKEVALELGFGKANDVAKKFPNSYVVGSDLIIVVDDDVQLAKPENAEEAYKMLNTLNNRAHQAITSVVVVNHALNIKESNIAVVDITFQNVPDEVIKAYIATGDPFDKAGGYARQHPLLKPYINVMGDSHALMGISTIQLREILEKLGIPVPNDDAKTIELFNNASLAEQRILR